MSNTGDAVAAAGAECADSDRPCDNKDCRKALHKLPSRSVVALACLPLDYLFFHFFVANKKNLQ